MSVRYTTGYPRLCRGRSCDLCGDWMMRGEHHTTWTWFASDKPWRGHAHILCTKTAHPRGGHDGWAVYRVGKKRAGRELDGRTWDQFPEVQQCRD